MSFDDDHVEIKHESFAQVRFSRVSGGGSRLFGSPIRKHGDSIVLTVKRSKEIHEGGLSRFYGGQELIRVEMSAAQFAALLTTMNVGDGVPCTLRRYNGEGVEPPPDEEDLEHERVAKSLANDGEYAQRINGHLDGAILELRGTLDRKTVRKADVLSALRSVESARREVRSNLPYMLEEFREACERVKTTVMTEADAWFTSVVQRAGLQALRGGGPSVQIEAEEPLQIPSEEP